jgi:tRNA-dihydrouridine synthase
MERSSRGFRRACCALTPTPLPPSPHFPPFNQPRSKGYNDGADIAHELIPQVAAWGAAAVTLHGRTRQQRYSRAADWDYIARCAAAAEGVGIPLIGNGDVMSWDDWAAHMGGGGGGGGAGVAACMIGRGALIKPWIFTGEGGEGKGAGGRGRGMRGAGHATAPNPNPISNPSPRPPLMPLTPTPAPAPFPQRSASSGCGTSARVSALSSSSSSAPTAWSTGAATTRAWRRRAASCWSG